MVVQSKRENNNNDIWHRFQGYHLGTPILESSKAIQPVQCAVKSDPESSRVGLGNANAMKRKSVVKSHRRLSLAHLTAFNTLGTALASLLAHETTAQSCQAREKRVSSC